MSNNGMRNALGALILVLLGAVAAGVAYVQHALAVAWERDPGTLCLTNRLLETATVLLVDKTDPLDAIQSRTLGNVIAAIRDRLRRGERLTVVVMGENGRPEPVRAFDLCSPGKGRDANFLYENDRLMQAKYEERFGAPLEMLLAELQKGGSASRSPIMEAIRDITSTPGFSAAVPERRLILISDLLQNTEAYSHYHSVSTSAAMAYATEVMPALAGAAVEVVYLLRPGAKHLQGDRHLAFWRDYFRLAGAERVTITRQ